jgi:hypothetical protein
MGLLATIEHLLAESSEQQPTDDVPATRSAADT